MNSTIIKIIIINFLHLPAISCHLSSNVFLSSLFSKALNPNSSLGMPAKFQIHTKQHIKLQIIPQPLAFMFWSDALMLGSQIS